MNRLKNDRYTYRVTWSEEDKEHVGLCAEFPGLSWLAPSPEAALRGIRAVVADAVKDMRASGEAIPEPLASQPAGARANCRSDSNTASTSSRAISRQPETL